MTYLAIKEYDKVGTNIFFNSSFEKDNFKKALFDTNGFWKKKLGLNYLPFYFNDNLNNLSLTLFCRGVTGFVKIGEITFEIMPKFLDHKNSKNWKIALANLLFLQENPLKYKSNLILSNPIKESLPDLLADTFIKELEKCIHLGLPNEYKYVEKELSYFKGSYNSRKAISHLLNPLYIPCKYDEYTSNTSINRLLKVAAATELSKLVSLPRKSINLMELASEIQAGFNNT